MVVSLRSVKLRSVKSCATIGLTRLVRLISGCRMSGGCLVAYYPLRYSRCSESTPPFCLNAPLRQPSQIPSRFARHCGLTDRIPAVSLLEDRSHCAG